MAYGTIKVDTITFTNGGSDQSISVSGVVQSISGNITATGTIQGSTIIGTSTVSGATVTGDAGQFTTATITSGVFASGTAAAPSISVGTTDNGIYSPGADQLAISTNGSGKLFVNSAGDIGIGAAPSGSYKLEVKGGATDSVALFDSTASVGPHLRFSTSGTDRHYLGSAPGFTAGGTSSDFAIRTAGYLALSTGGNNERLRITSDGKLGLGSSSPLSQLSNVSSNGGLSAANSTGIAWQSTANDWAGVISSRPASGAGYALRAHTEGTTSSDAIFVGSSGSGTGTSRFVITGAGAVGIGTTTPDTKANVVKNALTKSWSADADDVFAVENSGTCNVDFRAGSSASTYLMFSDGDARARGYAAYLHSSDALLFGAAGSERARIDSNGRLLVGTSSSPSIGQGQYAYLVVQGNTAGTTSSSVLSLQRGVASASVGANDYLGELDFGGSDGGTFAQIAGVCDGTAGSGDYPGRLVFSTTADGASSPTERMRITSDAYIRLASGTGGIQFNGDTAAANALDDYEEGTWTPTAAQGFTSPTYGANTAGIYTKVGNIVRIHGRLVLTGGTATASTIRIGGLPFTCQNTASQYVTCAYYLNAGAGTVGNALKPIVTPGQTYIEVFLQNNTNVTGVAGTTLGNTMDILVSATYQV